MKTVDERLTELFLEEATLRGKKDYHHPARSFKDNPYNKENNYEMHMSWQLGYLNEKVDFEGK